MDLSLSLWHACVVHQNRQTLLHCLGMTDVEVASCMHNTVCHHQLQPCMQTLLYVYAVMTCLCCDRCEGCLAVILEQVQFLNNSAIHGGGLDINATLPNPVIIVGSQFTYNSARVVTNDDGDSNLTTVLAGNGGGVRCLGGRHTSQPAELDRKLVRTSLIRLQLNWMCPGAFPCLGNAANKRLPGSCCCCYDELTLAVCCMLICLCTLLY